MTQPRGRGLVSDILNALRALKRYAEKQKKLLVVNMSLGTEGFDDYLASVIRTFLKGNDCIFVASIGNDGSGTNVGGSPGDYADVIGVGACDAGGRVGAFSSIIGIEGAVDKLKPDFYAPGVDVESAVAGGGYKIDCGTSYACPLLTALIAIYLAQGRITNEDGAIAIDKLHALLEHNKIAADCAGHPKAFLRPPDRYRVRYQRLP